MKKLILCIVLFFGCTIIAEAQWTRLDLPLGQYRDIFFSAEKTGFLVGDSGMVLKTVDDGATWRKIDIGVNSNLKSVHFPSANVGYIVGDSVFLKTTDGGETWKIKQDSIFRWALRLVFTTENIGFIENYFATPYRTEDGGNTWQIINAGTGINFINPAVGFCVESEIKWVGKTIDSGKTWNWIKAEDQNGFYGYGRSTCWFTDEYNGMIAGFYDGFLSLTSNGGKNWEALTGYRKLLKDSSGIIGNGVYDIFFPTKKIGYAIGDIKSIIANSEHSILKTKDGGKNWTVLPGNLNFFSNILSQIYFTDENTGYLVNPEQVLKTTNGGEEPVSVQEPLLKTISTAISPNPFKNSARIELPGDLLQTEIRIFTANGEDCTDCFKSEVFENSVTLERISASAGAYYFTIKSEGKIVAEGKFVVE